MRILHTSDWHIGQRLYERSRIDEHSQFLDWLLEVIREERVDALLVAGDIFDSALPSAESTDLYYHFLFRLYSETDASAVIIAGNHDSAVRLAAPKKFLAMARIHVVGEISDRLDECIITLGKENFNLAIAAVPYLSESELLSHVSFESQIDRASRYREALKALYMRCLAKMSRRMPIMLMGHFFLHGGAIGESERAVQIGGSMPISTHDLPPNIDYFALGHLHRPQQIKGREYPVVYSGSPLPMTFKEATYDQKLYLLDLDNWYCLDSDRAYTKSLKSITIPVFKELCRVRGNFNDIIAEARSDSLDWHGKYIEVQLQLDAPVLGAADTIRNAFAERGGEVLVVEALAATRRSDSDMSAEEITAKSPEDIFASFYKSKYGADELQQEMAELMATFKELLTLASEEDKK